MLRNTLSRISMGHRWWHKAPNYILLIKLTMLTDNKVKSTILIVDHGKVHMLGVTRHGGGEQGWAGGGKTSTAPSQAQQQSRCTCMAQQTATCPQSPGCGARRCPRGRRELTCTTTGTTASSPRRASGPGRPGDSATGQDTSGG